MMVSFIVKGAGYAIFFFKMTDSTMGFGKKIAWGREEKIKICV